MYRSQENCSDSFYYTGCYLIISFPNGSPYALSDVLTDDY